MLEWQTRKESFTGYWGLSLKRNSLDLAKMLSLREVHIWYGDLKYWGVYAIQHL
jgi:hypothetical protein